MEIFTSKEFFVEISEILWFINICPQGHIYSEKTGLLIFVLRMHIYSEETGLFLGNTFYLKFSLYPRKHTFFWE